MRLLTLPGVFRPRPDSWLLADMVREQAPAGGRVLDRCTGSGVLALSAARGGAAAVTAVDCSRRAIWTARLNGLLRGGAFAGDGDGEMVAVIRARRPPTPA